MARAQNDRTTTDIAPIELMNYLPPGSKSSPEKLSAVSVDTTKDGKYVVVADSGKYVYLFSLIGGTSWQLVANWQMEQRLVKVQFDSPGRIVIMTDKTGDIYLSLIGIKDVSKPKKALGHVSYVLDATVTQDNSQIITCDRDEKIRVSSFPNAVEIQDYKLGHKEAVVNIDLVCRDAFLVSMSAEGTVSLWRFRHADDKDLHRPLKSWNIFTVLGNQHRRSSTMSTNSSGSSGGSGAVEGEVVKMRATEIGGNIYLGVVVTGPKGLFVFEIKPIAQTLRLFGETKLDHEFVDICWSDERSLYVYAPEEGSVKRYNVLSGHGGLIKDEAFKLPITEFTVKDMNAFGAYNRAFLPLRKRATASLVTSSSDSAGAAGSSKGGATNKLADTLMELTNGQDFLQLNKKHRIEETIDEEEAAGPSAASPAQQ